MSLPEDTLVVEIRDLPIWVREGKDKNEQADRLSIALDRMAGYRGPDAGRVLGELDELTKELFE